MAKYKFKFWDEERLIDKAKFDNPEQLNNIFKDLKKKMGVK